MTCMWACIASWPPTAPQFQPTLYPSGWYCSSIQALTYLRSTKVASTSSGVRSKTVSACLTGMMTPEPRSAPCSFSSCTKTTVLFRKGIWSSGLSSSRHMLQSFTMRLPSFDDEQPHDRDDRREQGNTRDDPRTQGNHDPSSKLRHAQEVPDVQELVGQYHRARGADEEEHVEERERA